MPYFAAMGTLNAARTRLDLAAGLRTITGELEAPQVRLFALLPGGAALVEISPEAPTPGMPKPPNILPRSHELGACLEGAAALATPEWQGWRGIPLSTSDGVLGVLAVQHPDGASQLDLLIPDIAITLQRVTEHDGLSWQPQALDALMRHTQQGIIGVSLDGQLVLYSPSLEAITGWSADDVSTHGWTNLVYKTAEERQAALAAISALVLGKASEGTVRSMACKSGVTKKLAVYSAVILRSGAAPLLLGIMDDVTESIASSQREHTETQLLRLGTLAGTIAHDFNNILCGIMGHADLLRYRPNIGPEISRHAEVILGAAEQGARLTQQLLAFGGTTNSQPQSVAPGAAIEQLTALMRATLPPEVQLELQIDSDLPAVEVDPGQLQQALTNLVRNAQDAMGKQGTIQLSARCTPLPEGVQFQASGCAEPGTMMVCLRVQDSGPGFSANALDRLFEPFFSTKQHGHGIGLAALRGIVQAHSGAIRVRNDGGAVVEIYLAPSSRPEQALPTLLQGSHGTGQRVWMLDDDGHVREFGLVSLTHHGYKVQAFSSGSQLSSALQSGQPDLLVINGFSPEEDTATIAQLQAQAAHIPVIWASSLQPPEGTWGSGSLRYLQKPFTGDALAAAVAQSLPAQT